MKLAYDKKQFTDSQKQIVRDYFANPDQRLKDLSERYHTFESAVSLLLTKVMKMHPSDRKELLSPQSN